MFARRLAAVKGRRAWGFGLVAGAVLCVGSTTAKAAGVAPVACTREVSSLDHDWRFHLGDVPGSERPAADDNAWRRLDVPHDWAIEGPFAEENPSGGAGGYAPMGVGWYRRHLATPAAGCARRVMVRFEGVMAHSEVWINGHSVGQRPNGYVTLDYDVTPWLDPKPGADNVLAVRADNSRQPSSRFYQGAGIYRHVRLEWMPEVHVAAWSTVARTPGLTIAPGGAAPASVTVHLTTALRNDSARSATAAVRFVVLDAAEREVAHVVAPAAAIAAGAETPFAADVVVPRPMLWDLRSPVLYRARVEVLPAGAKGDAARVAGADREEISFGIRDAHFEAATGFWLNGRNVKIKGVALHSDVGALGMAAPLGVWEHRLTALQRMGANAIRTAHNPVAPEFLDLCDRMGFLVLDEFFDQWTVGKVAFDYHVDFRHWFERDARDTVRRDRNHPSIFAWSAGNEIHDTPHPEIAKPILAALIAVYHAEDPTRPVTQALFRPNASHDYDDGLADMLDVIGQNYRPNELIAAHEAKPTRKVMGTENIHDRETWVDVRDLPFYSGMFLWSGTDYLGESRHWPVIGYTSGMLDRTNFPRPDALEREAWWTDANVRPVVHVVRRTAPVQKAPTDPGYELEQYRPKETVFADWTPADRSAHTEHVEVYSNCAEVKLTLNGQDLGAKPLPADARPRTWDVSFAPGALTAKCTGVSTSETLRTAGAASKVKLELESRPGGSLGGAWDHVLLLRATVVDKDGTALPDASVPVTFTVSGGELLATDNADAVYREPFRSATRETWHGRAVAYVRPGRGKGTVTANAPGLASSGPVPLQ